RDELYESAVDLVVREGRGSVSLLQRALGIGYGRAARLIDFMAEDGIVGQYNGSQARDILITLADWERMQGSAAEEESAPPATSTRMTSSLPPRRNIVRPEPWEEEEEETMADDEVAQDKSADDDSAAGEEYQAESA